MGRRVAQAIAKTLAVGLAAALGTTGMAQAPARDEALPGMLAQGGIGPEFRAARQLRLATTDEGPSADAPLSFGRSQPSGDVRPMPVVPGSSPPQERAREQERPQERTRERESSQQAAATATTTATTAAAATGRHGDADHVAAPGAVRDEAQSLAQLRSRLEEVIARHADVDAKAQGDALRVVSRTSEASPASLAATPAPRSQAAGVTSKRPAGPAEWRDWSYSGDTGPEHWARMNPHWAACGADVPQSPIDIRDGIAVGLPEIGFDFPPAVLTIRDDGRTIRVVVREGPAIATLGRRFELREIGFHQPAEFRIDGEAFDLSAQLVHRDEQGRAAIVVVLFEIGDESSPRNPVVQTVLDHLPLAIDMPMPVADPADLAALLPADRGYYNFVGSLTAPPCTEGVIWMVMREPLRVPPSQVAIFARVHPGNVRPLQPLAGRLIKQSE